MEHEGRERSLLWFIPICLLWTAAVSNQSLWLDEAAGAGWKATQTTLSEWWQDDLAQNHSSDALMPLYLLYLWGYARIFGASEWVLRAANLPWMFFGLWIWLRALGWRSPVTWGVALAAASSPFLWYYLNEARPYAMQAGCGFLIAAALQRLHAATNTPNGCGQPDPLTQQVSGPLSGGGFWVAMLCFGLVGLAGSNLLGGIWAGAAAGTVFFVLGWRKSWKLAQRHPVQCFATLAVLAAFGCYYLWKVRAGSGATTVGQTDAKNLAFIFYELLGFGGFGPGRADIRGSGLSSFRPYAGWLAAYALVLAPVIWSGVQQVWRSRPRRSLVLIVVFCGAASAFILVAGAASHFRALGRHFTPLLVPIVYLAGMGTVGMWTSGTRVSRGWVLLFVAASLASCLSLRFGERHLKDDYRGAAAIARAALQRGETVWWNANQRGAGYYGVATTTNDYPRHAARFFMNPDVYGLQRAMVPTVVITSKPDVFDAGGALAEYLRANRFQISTNLRAFAVWQRVAEIP